MVIKIQDKNWDSTITLLEKVKNSDKISQENKKLILNYYNEKIASGGIKPRSMHYKLKILSRLGEAINKNFKDLTKEELIQFFNELTPQDKVMRKGDKEYRTPIREYSEMSLWLYKQSIKAFWRWLFENDGTVAKDRFGSPPQVSWIKGSLTKVKNKYPKEVLTREEVQKMIKSCKNLRDKAIIALLFETGTRASELLGMRKKEIYLNTDYAEFKVDGKTGERQVMAVKSYPYLKQWIDFVETHKEMVNPEHNEFIWLTFPKVGTKNNKFIHRSTLLTTGGLAALIKRAGQKAGIQKRVWTHGFRHSSATDFAKQGYTEVEMRTKYGWAPTSQIPANYTHYKYDDLKNKILHRNGKTTEAPQIDAEMIPIRECPFCSYENPFENEYCGKCAKPLNEKLIKDSEKTMKAYAFTKEVINNLSMLEKKGFDIRQFNQFIEEWVKQKN